MRTHPLFLTFVALAVYAQNLTGFALALICSASSARPRTISSDRGAPRIGERRTRSMTSGAFRR
jgi:hypothetical protein